MVCHPDTPCVKVSPRALRAILNDPDTITDDMEEIINIPERRSLGYLFRSRRSSFEDDNDEPMKRSSSYLLRTRKSTLTPIEPPVTRGEYLFRTRKSTLPTVVASTGLEKPRSERGSYLFRTRKMDPIMERMVRSQGKGYLFRTRR